MRLKSSKYGVRSWDSKNITSAWSELFLTVLVADVSSRCIHFCFPAEGQGLWTKVPYMSCSLTQAYLFSLTLTCHVDMTLQPCVNSEEKCRAVFKRRKCTRPRVDLWVHANVAVINVLPNNVNHFGLLDNPNPPHPNTSADVKTDCDVTSRIDGYDRL